MSGIFRSTQNRKETVSRGIIRAAERSVAIANSNLRLQVGRFLPLTTRVHGCVQHVKHTNGAIHIERAKFCVCCFVPFLDMLHVCTMYTQETQQRQTQAAHTRHSEPCTHKDTARYAHEKICIKKNNLNIFIIGEVLF